MSLRRMCARYSFCFLSDLVKKVDNRASENPFLPKETIPNSAVRAPVPLG